MTLTRAPVEAKNSVTESPRSFATQTWVPSELMAIGSLNPSRADDDLDQGAGRAEISVTELP